MTKSTRPRLKGHQLIWMATTRGQCECGEDLQPKPEELEGMSDDEARDMIMDLHSDHLEMVRVAQ